MKLNKSKTARTVPNKSKTKPASKSMNPTTAQSESPPR